MVLATRDILGATFIGLGATLGIDLWSVFLKRGFNIPSLNFCLLGRWLLHMPSGTFRHERIGAAAAKRGECAAGWVSHYLIGAAFALGFVAIAPAGWLGRPTLLPAVAFGVATTVVPLFVLQPSLGLGMASSRTPNPGQARVKSLATHTVFGAGLYLWAMVLGRVLPPG